jgi:transcriptional regulator with XRE-family HTH domain
MTMSTLGRFDWTLGDRLAKSRKVAGLTADGIADELGVSRNTVTNWETGATRPKRQTLIAWAQITGAPLEWLVEGDTRPLGDADQFTDVGTRASGWNHGIWMAAA